METIFDFNPSPDELRTIIGRCSLEREKEIMQKYNCANPNACCYDKELYISKYSEDDINVAIYILFWSRGDMERAMIYRNRVSQEYVELRRGFDVIRPWYWW